MQKVNEGLTMILMHKSTQQFGCIFSNSSCLYLYKDLLTKHMKYTFIDETLKFNEFIDGKNNKIIN